MVYAKDERNRMVDSKKSISLTGNFWHHNQDLLDGSAISPRAGSIVPLNKMSHGSKELLGYIFQCFIGLYEKVGINLYFVRIGGSPCLSTLLSKGSLVDRM
jgi:hypothetical protein